MSPNPVAPASIGDVKGFHESRGERNWDFDARAWDGEKALDNEPLHLGVIGQHRWAYAVDGVLQPVVYVDELSVGRK